MEQLPVEVQWHFIGTLQSNKAKILAAIPNLHTVQTLTSTKTATALNKSLPPERVSPLNVLIQVNTSGEDSKSGLAPLTPGGEEGEQDQDVLGLAMHILGECPRLHLQGLMTIGSLAESLQAEEENRDFDRLRQTRDVLEKILRERAALDHWGEQGRLLLSMGMTGDFEAAIAAGSDIVRVGTGIFGERQKKEDVTVSC
jgi:PLP dependent protein